MKQFSFWASIYGKLTKKQEGERGFICKAVSYRFFFFFFTIVKQSKCLPMATNSVLIENLATIINANGSLR